MVNFGGQEVKDKHATPKVDFEVGRGTLLTPLVWVDFLVWCEPLLTVCWKLLYAVTAQCCKSNCRCNKNFAVVDAGDLKVWWTVYVLLTSFLPGGLVCVIVYKCARIDSFLWISYVVFNISVICTLKFVALIGFMWDVFVAKEILMVPLHSTLKLLASWSRHMSYARWTFAMHI